MLIQIYEALTLFSHLLSIFFLFHRASSDANIPSLILANLKWLDCIVDSDTLTTKIVEIIEGSPVKVWSPSLLYFNDLSMYIYNERISMKFEFWPEPLHVQLAASRYKMM